MHHQVSGATAGVIFVFCATAGAIKASIQYLYKISVWVLLERDPRGANANLVVFYVSSVSADPTLGFWIYFYVSAIGNAVTMGACTDTERNTW
jgi:hypothetical protein